MRDRGVVGRRVAREAAARGVGLELVNQDRGAGDALERGTEWPALMASRVSSTAL
jgi:hypothetical protein